MLNSVFVSQCIHRFPSVSFAFAYGSAVLPQLGKPAGGKMIDLCCVIDDETSVKWHRENLSRNPSDYSLIARLLGADFIANIQRVNNVGVWYNTLVPLENFDKGHAPGNNNNNTAEYMKYGVVEKRDFIADLVHWHSLYLGGRCQKPVLYLDRLPPTEDLRSALEVNLKSALNTALLQLPPKFSAEQLFTCVAGLSYHGDFRMIIGEDRNKIKKLVLGALPRLLELYLPILRSDSSLQINGNVSETDVSNVYLEQDLSPAIKFKRLVALPKVMRNNLLHLNHSLPSSGFWRHQVANPDVEDIFANMASWSDDSRLIKLLNQSTRRIVFSSSISQTAKGIITAGPFKSVRYASDKVAKTLQSIFVAKKV